MSFNQEIKLLKSPETLFQDLERYSKDKWFPKFYISERTENSVAFSPAFSFSFISTSSSLLASDSIIGHISGNKSHISFERKQPYILLFVCGLASLLILFAQVEHDAFSIHIVLRIIGSVFIVLILYLVYKYQQNDLLKKILVFLEAEGFIEKTRF